jgi:hypothetical protein
VCQQLSLLLLLRGSASPPAAQQPSELLRSAHHIHWHTYWPLLCIQQSLAMQPKQSLAHLNIIRVDGTYRLLSATGCKGCKGSAHS